MKKLIVSLALASAAITAGAEVLAPPGQLDSRVRVVTYSPSNVVRINTYYGVSTHIQFGGNENIQDVAVGDDLAWQVVSRRNNLFIKPKAKEGDTNVTVITNLRTYQFVVTLLPAPAKSKNAWQDPNLTYSLSFRYTDEEKARRDALAAADAEKSQRANVRNRLANATVKAGHNMDYWVAGDAQVSPTGAYDDGRFVYLTFSANRDMPAVYESNSRGEESLVNTNVVSGNTIVVQRLVKTIVLRKGEYVASVLNRAFDSEGGKDNLTGTIANDVNRVTKGED